MMLEFRPLNKERWPDLETLFGQRGACGGCWCMYWRVPAKEFAAGKGAKNRAALKKLVTRGAASGIIAYADGRPIGWCALEPRTAFVRLENSRVLHGPDDAEVWAAPCLFVAREFRKQGISVKLLQAAVAHAGSCGAKLVEGYPVIPRKGEMPAAFAWTGTLAAFEKAGFVEVARHSPVRPIMRCTTKRATRKRSPARKTTR